MACRDRALFSLISDIKPAGDWLVAFILLGAIVFLFQIYIPVLSVFLLATTVLSLDLAILLVPFLIIKRLITHLKEKHLG